MENLNLAAKDLSPNDERNNQVIGTGICNFDFGATGKNNILVWNGDSSKPVKCSKQSKITFHGSNSIVFIGKNDGENEHSFDIQICGDNFCYIGDDTIFNIKTRPARIMCTYGASIFIGNECLIEDRCRIKTSDGHPIYGSDSKKLINKADNIYIGDHCWIGVESFILKGTEIGSGGIINTKALISKGKIPSNSLSEKIPAEVTQRNVFHINSIIDKDTEETCAETKYIYSKDNTYTTFKEVQDSIMQLPVSERANKLKEYNTNYKSTKNRFFRE